MKTVIISLEDEVYASLQQEATNEHMSLSDFLGAVVQDLRSDRLNPHPSFSSLDHLWAMADDRPVSPGSVEPLNREELYTRGISGY
jgi:hypothetical protein